MFDIFLYGATVAILSIFKISSSEEYSKLVSEELIDTVKISVPNDWTLLWTLFDAPVPIPTRIITDAIPIINPSIVKDVRNLLLFIFFNAILIVSNNLILNPFFIC